MKIKGFFINEKRYIKKWIFTMLIFFIIGIVSGTLYCTSLASDYDSSVSSYLSSYFEQIRNNCEYISIFKNSLFDYFKIFIIIFVSAFFRPGVILTTASVILKGFIIGFTSASFIKYFNIAGLLASLSSLPSTLIYLPSLLMLASASVVFAINRHRQEKSKLKGYIVLSICCLTIFCVASLFDTFITTTFMKIISSVFVD